jgi:hypothetical protein
VIYIILEHAKTRFCYRSSVYELISSNLDVATYPNQSVFLPNAASNANGLLTLWQVHGRNLSPPFFLKLHIPAIFALVFISFCFLVSVYPRKWENCCVCCGSGCYYICKPVIRCLLIYGKPLAQRIYIFTITDVSYLGGVGIGCESRTISNSFHGLGKVCLHTMFSQVILRFSFEELHGRIYQFSVLENNINWIQKSGQTAV